jgi:adenine/guanine/hypoxanthine permease
MISTVLSFFGPLILKYVPPAALLVPIAGIGIAFLGLEQIGPSIAAPIVGYYAIMFVFIGWYAGVKVGYGFFRLPEALQVILVGAILGWVTGYNSSQNLRDAADLVKWYGPDWAAKELFENFSVVADYLGIVIPIAISATATTLMCLVSAKQAGDPFPVRESMIVDGLGTMLSSLFGSPFGTVIYIGHPAHKRSGALVGYSLTNGMIYIVLSWFGVLALMQAIVNPATIGPIVLFVGLMVNEEALSFMPPRHYGAYIIGLFPSIYDWAVNVAGMTPIQDFDTGGNQNLTGNESWYGVLAWKRGALLVSTVWALIAAIFALFGIIHVPEAGFDNFSKPVWEQCEAFPGDCWEFGEQWMYFVAYIMLAGTYVLIEISRATGFDTELLPPIDDEAHAAFGDWFKDAAVASGPYAPKQDTTAVVEEYPDASKKTAMANVDSDSAEDKETGDEKDIVYQ